MFDACTTLSKPNVLLADCWRNPIAQSRLKAELQDLVLELSKTFPPAFAKRQHIISRLVEYARQYADIIRFSE